MEPSGRLTGPSHSGVELHGFLSYLVRCNLEERPCTVFGHKGKQVGDNIHSHGAGFVLMSTSRAYSIGPLAGRHRDRRRATENPGTRLNRGRVASIQP